MVPVPWCYDSCLVTGHGNGMLPMAALHLLVDYSVILEEIWSDLCLVILGWVHFEEREMELPLELGLVLPRLDVAVLFDQVCYCFYFDSPLGLWQILVVQVGQ